MLRKAHMKTSSFFSKLLLWVLGLVIFGDVAFLSGCGSSGSDDSGNSDSGSASLSITPEAPIQGTLASIEVEFDGTDFDDIDTQGLTVKLIAPAGLGAIHDTAILSFDDRSVSLPVHAIAPVPEPLMRSLLSDEGASTAEIAATASVYSFFIFSIPADVLRNEEGAVLQMSFNVVNTPITSYVFSDVDRGAIAVFDPEHSDFDGENSVSFGIQER